MNQNIKDENDKIDDEIFVNNKLNTAFILDEEDDILDVNEGMIKKNDIQTLQDMGYDKKMINKVYLFLHPPNIERAIDYMTEIDGIYQHDFIENDLIKKDDECMICGKRRKAHLDYIPPQLLLGTDRINNRLNNRYTIFNDIFTNDEDNDNVDYLLDFNDEEEEEVKIKPKKKIEDKKYKVILNHGCSVCFEEIQEEEKKSNSLPCGHYCCKNCWTTYFKTLITDAKVEKIKCVEHECKQIIPEDFILKYIKDNKKLMEKYQKFKIRAEIIKDPNKKQCPKPDCPSYLEKSPTTKYVKCKKGHEYCFECLRAPHGKSSCEELMEKDFLKWKKKRLLKRCPRCQIFTEKNEGCNHMTCSSCKYQWCWLCLGKYTYGHYDRGQCQGYQFTKADSLAEAKKGRRGKYHYYHEQNQNLCYFTVFTLFPCFFHGFDRPFTLYGLWERYLCIIIMWFFGFFLFAGTSMVNFSHDRIDLGSVEVAYYMIGVLMTIFLYICFQILFIGLITPFLLIALVYPYYIDKILMFLDMNV